MGDLMAYDVKTTGEAVEEVMVAITAEHTLTIPECVAITCAVVDTLPHRYTEVSVA